ncbi:glycosyltransferase [Candidatus Pelagibacter sp.]|nr:glycosyltransferase [Candidatus Pelagibacter sp.]
MKILHIITSLNNGGAENHLAELASKQAKQKKDKIYIIYLRGDNYWEKFLRKKNINVKKIIIKNNHNLVGLIFVIFKIFKITKKIKPEIIHAHLSLSEIIVTFLKLIFRLDFKMVISKHLDSFLFEGSRGQNKFFSGLFLERIIFYISDHVIFISKNVQSYFLSEIKVPPEKKSVIYYGINKKNFIMKNASKNKKIKFKKKKNQKVILNIARHTVQKKIDLLIRGFTEYQKINKNSKLILVGSGPETEKLKLLAEKLQIKSKIQWINYTNNVFDLFKISDVFCLTSRYEGLGLVLLESLISRVPVITMKSSAMKEVVKNNHSGLLLSENCSPKSLSIALNKVLNNEKFRKKIIKNGFVRLSQKFNVNKMLKLTTNAYKI